MTFEDAVTMLGGGLSAAVIAGLVWAVIALRAENQACQKRHLADKDADKERLLKMAEQNREVALAANTVTISNTAAMDAQKAQNERILSALSRIEGKQ